MKNQKNNLWPACASCERYLQNAEIVGDLLAAGADPNLVAKFSVHNVPGRNYSPFEMSPADGGADGVGGRGGVVGGGGIGSIGGIGGSAASHHPMDIQDISPLDIAVLSGNFFTTRALLEHGAFADHCDTLSGNTAAMIAAAMRDFDVLGLLIDFGASRARQNNQVPPTNIYEVCTPPPPNPCVRAARSRSSVVNAPARTPTSSLPLLTLPICLSACWSLNESVSSVYRSTCVSVSRTH
jgi:hypothetical protein